MNRSIPRLRTFLFVWFGQLVSLVGSGLTSFALGIWVYERTGSATEFALISVFAVLPGIVVSPVAGVLVDRYDRRKIMILSDTVAGLSTVAIALLLFSGRLEIWHIYVSALVSSTASAFQYPAYAASTTLMVPKKHLGRAAGLTRAADAVSLIVAPALAGVLVGIIGLEGIILIDFATFLFAVATLALVRFPPTPRSDTATRATLRGDITFGLRYLLDRRGLLWLSLFFTLLNAMFAFCNVLLTPMVLAFSDAEALGAIVSALGGGLLLGSVVMSTWGGPKRRILGAYWFGIGQGLMLILASLRPDIGLIAVAMFGLAFGGPIADGSINAIRQAKIAPDVQGRVFAFNRMLSWCAIPVSYLLAGPLADNITEPLMQPGGALANSVGAIIGVGAGRGIGLIYFAAGVISLLATVIAIAYPRVRNIETELPDVISSEPHVPSTGILTTDPV